MFSHHELSQAIINVLKSKPNISFSIEQLIDLVKPWIDVKTYDDEFDFESYFKTVCFILPAFNKNIVKEDTKLYYNYISDSNDTTKGEEFLKVDQELTDKQNVNKHDDIIANETQFRQVLKLLSDDIECFENFNIKYPVINEVSVYDAICVLCKHVDEIDFIEEFDDVCMKELMDDVKATKNLELCVSLIDNNYNKTLKQIQNSHRQFALYYQGFSMFTFTLYSYLYFSNYNNMC